MTGAGAPAAVTVLRTADRRAVAWKNGGGVTREIAAWPEGAGMDDFAWRVSLAEVAADGPFSVFPGVDRTLTLAEGAGMRLTMAGAMRSVSERYVPERFPGDAPTHCRLLDGPVVNFNVMHRRGLAPADTAVVRGALALASEPGTALLIVPLAGPADLTLPDGGTVHLARHDAALLRAPAGARLHAPTPTAVVHLPTP
ncbi:HutD family protein [Streptomyces sp. NPDC032472]|uniref:HutD/Ves family protein n=1 Tax=Streptomyces sp. NPDC032472 TaxID=3155018 RepID=UPI00340A03FB